MDKNKLDIFRKKANEILNAGLISEEDKIFWHCEFNENPAEVYCFVERYANNLAFLPYSTANLKRRERERRLVRNLKKNL